MKTQSKINYFILFKSDSVSVFIPGVFRILLKFRIILSGNVPENEEESAEEKR